MKRYKPLFDQLREFVQADERSENAIAKGAGIDQANLNKFQAGKKGLSIDAIDRLCVYLHLELIKRD